MPDRLPVNVLLGQTLRKLLKATIWQTLTTIPKLLGQPLQTVQVLVVDRGRKLVLLLRTAESKTGYFPIQGLRLGMPWLSKRLRYQADPREDARRELAEEAVATELRLDEFRFIHRYLEGSRGQFDCRVYLVEADSGSLWLVDENAEGLPVWESFETAGNVLNQTLAGIMAGLPPVGVALESLEDPGPVA